MSCVAICFFFISTHALTWSATFFGECIHAFQEISTHALTWSATLYSSFYNFSFRFQLTHSRGVRLLINVTHKAPMKISTHALTWSATRICRRKYPTTCISTHALTWSATSCVNCRNIKAKFQLTHSRGVRRKTSLHAAAQFRISTHALTWSATDCINDAGVSFYISTHALTWSATGFPLLPLWIFQISTHALTWSATWHSRIPEIGV